MATVSRGRPYIWVTGITGHLAGDRQCEFATWLRAHFKYDRIEDGNFDRAAWTADHTTMVLARAAELRADGWTVHLEGENQFRLHGKSLTLGGKPDIVALKAGEALVVDCKTGKQRHSDYFQVLLYLLALPRCFEDLSKVRIVGEVCYRTARIGVRPEELTQERLDAVFALLRRAGSDVKPNPQPSASECALCDVSSVDCPSRAASDAVGEAVAGVGEF